MDGDDRLAARRAGGAAIEVHLPADAGVEQRAERIRADLAGEVDLQGDVDGDLLVLLGDDERVVDVFRRMEREPRVVVDVVVEPPGSHAEAGDDLALIERLAAPVDGARLDQLDDGVGEHLGVDAEVLLVLEVRHHRLRNRADAELDRRVVLDQGGDVFADLARFRVRLGHLHLDQRRVGGHEHVDVVDVQEPVAQRARHVGVDLGDDEAGVLRGALDDVDGDPEAAHAPAVRRAHLDEGYIQRQLAGREQAGNVGQEDGRVVPQSFLDDLADVVGDEEAVDAEVFRQRLVRVRRVARSQQVDDGRVGKLAAARHESAHELLRLSASGADEYPLAGADPLAASRLRGSADRSPASSGLLPAAAVVAAPPGGAVPGAAPEGAQFAPWDGPAALMSHVFSVMRASAATRSGRAGRR